MGDILLKGDTFHRDQDPSGEGHDLGSASRRWVFGKELAVDFIYDAKVIAADHENGGLYDPAQAAARFFQNDLDILESLPDLILKIIADDFS